MADDAPHFEPAKRFTLSEVAAYCPCCNHCHADLPLEEDIAGAYRVLDEHRFIKCESCGGLFDAGAQEFHPHDATDAEYPSKILGR